MVKLYEEVVAIHTGAELNEMGLSFQLELWFMKPRCQKIKLPQYIVLWQ